VAGLLRTAEEFAKDADTVRREAEEALELVETQRAELSQMLALARSEAAAAERRAVAAEERLQEALERTFALECAARRRPRAEPVAGGPRQLTELRRRLMTSIMGVRSVERLQQLPGDHDALDLVGALVDLRDLRVAHEPLDGYSRM
jgi:hypothetical protein